MGFNIKEIFTAWSIAINPNERQKEIAEKRWEICMECPHRIETFQDKEWSFRCGECGCPLKGKIFTNDYDACPKNKWLVVEKEYFQIKKEKTLI